MLEPLCLHDTRQEGQSHNVKMGGHPLLCAVPPEQSTGLGLSSRALLRRGLVFSMPIRVFSHVPGRRQSLPKGASLTANQDIPGQASKQVNKGNPPGQASKQVNKGNPRFLATAAGPTARHDFS